MDDEGNVHVMLYAKGRYYMQIIDADKHDRLLAQYGNYVNMWNASASPEDKLCV